MGRNHLTEFELRNYGITNYGNSLPNARIANRTGLFRALGLIAMPRMASRLFSALDAELWPQAPLLLQCAGLRIACGARDYGNSLPNAPIANRTGLFRALDLIQKRGKPPPPILIYGHLPLALHRWFAALSALEQAFSLAESPLALVWHRA